MKNYDIQAESYTGTLWTVITMVIHLSLVLRRRSVIDSRVLCLGGVINNAISF